VIEVPAPVNVLGQPSLVAERAEERDRTKSTARRKIAFMEIPYRTPSRMASRS
jgi:hypothetical protein